MKKYVVLFVVFLPAFLFPNCRTAKVPYTALVTSIPDVNGADGLIRLQSTGQGSNEDDALSNAERNAFNALLFTGLSGSAQERPMIADEAHARSSNPAYFHDFFTRQGYRKFITAISNNGFKKDKDGKKITTVTAKINLDALRKNLENNHLIKKLGL